MEESSGLLRHSWPASVAPHSLLGKRPLFAIPQLLQHWIFMYSSIARLQQLLTIAILATGAGLVAWSLLEPGWSVVFLFMWFTALPAVLALQFGLAGWVNSQHGVATGRPFPWAAWWAEVKTASITFGFWQPWAWRRLPDSVDGGKADVVNQHHAGRGVLLVHGFTCNRGLWTPLMAELSWQKQAFVAVNLEPIFGSIDEYRNTLDNAVRQLTLATGEPPLVVAHSMGGLAVRAWLRGTPGALNRVSHVMTVGTPHQGTWLARFGFGVNSLQMREGSAWLAELSKSEEPATRAKFTCWHSDGDNIVFPYGTGVLTGSIERHLPGLGHVVLASAPELIEDVVRQLKRDQ